MKHKHNTVLKTPHSLIRSLDFVQDYPLAPSLRFITCWTLSPTRDSNTAHHVVDRDLPKGPDAAGSPAISLLGEPLSRLWYS